MGLEVVVVQKPTDSRTTTSNVVLPEKMMCADDVLKTLRGFVFGYPWSLWRLFVGCFLVFLLAAKKPFFNNVFDSFLGLVLGLFQLFGYVLEVSVYVGVSGGNTSVLAAAVLGVCGGSGGTVR